MYDFETYLNRYDVGSRKWDEMRHYGITPEMRIVPMSNAEMEFPNPPEIIRGLKQYVEHTALAYFTPPETYFEAVMGWMKDRHDFSVERDWIVPYPGIHGALSVIIEAYSREGDGAIVLPPTWPGFFDVLERNNRLRVDSPLVLQGQRYSIDYDDFEKKARSPRSKLLLFCSPHNPVGRVWTREELTRVGRICLENDVLIVSDEAHSDLVMPGHKHIPFASLSPEIARRTITCTAPSKTFNLAGLHTSNVIIPDRDLRDRFNAVRARYGISRPNMLGLKACELAYSSAGGWLDACIEKIYENCRYVETFLRERLPMLNAAPLEGTYLMWADLRPLKLDAEEAETSLARDAHLFFDSGHYFGEEGSGFQRINIACPTNAVKDAMERLLVWTRSHEAPVA